MSTCDVFARIDGLGIVNPLHVNRCGRIIAFAIAQAFVVLAPAFHFTRLEQGACVGHTHGNGHRIVDVFHGDGHITRLDSRIISQLFVVVSTPTKHMTSAATVMVERRLVTDI